MHGQGMPKSVLLTHGAHCLPGADAAQKEDTGLRLAAQWI